MTIAVNKVPDTVECHVVMLPKAVKLPEGQCTEGVAPYLWIPTFVLVAFWHGCGFQGLAIPCQTGADYKRAYNYLHNPGADFEVTTATILDKRNE